MYRPICTKVYLSALCRKRHLFLVTKMSAVPNHHPVHQRLDKNWEGKETAKRAGKREIMGNDGVHWG